MSQAFFLESANQNNLVNLALLMGKYGILLSENDYQLEEKERKT